MAQASRNFINVALDGDKGTTRAIMKKFGVRGYPTVIFLKPNEEEIKTFVGYGDPLRDPVRAKQEMDSIFKDYAKEAASVTWAETVGKAMEKADDHLIFVFFHDEKKGSRAMEEHTLGNLNVLQVIGKSFIGVKVEFDRRSELAKKYRVYSAPSMVVVDREGNKIASTSGAKRPKEAIRFLEKALKRYERKSRK